MGKINISFIGYGGLSYAGAQKQSMGLAKILDKNIFNVRYFWCKHILDKYSDFSYPEQNLNFINDLKKEGVETIEFHVGYRDISNPYHLWGETNFFEIYNKYPTDLNFSVSSGRPLFPIININKPYIEWNVFGSVDTQSKNLIFSVGVSPWVQKTYIKNGGNEKNSGYCLYGLHEPLTQENLKEKLAIPQQALVIGFHQRDDDGIFGEHALKSWKEALNKSDRELYFLVLGGSKKYKTLAKELGIPVNFLPIVSDSLEVSKFLNTLDIFSHSAGAGESLGIAVQEAMIHKLPVVSMYGKNNGHIDVIGDTIEIAKDQNDYNRIILDLIQNDNKRNNVSFSSYKRAIDNFSVDSMKKYFENLFIEKNNEYKNIPVQGLNLSICNKIYFRTYLYRFLYRFPKLMNVATYLYLKIKILRNKTRKWIS